MLEREKVLAFVREKGPVLPRDVSKALGGDTFFTGAVLSTLVDNKELKLSHAKIGGSPVYYQAGQEHKLEMLFKFLAGKEKEAFNMLKANRVMRDNETEPAIRVAFRNIKDFAKPLEVNISGNKEIFWKWYMLSNQEAEALIRQIVSPKQEPVVQVAVPEIAKPPLPPMQECAKPMEEIKTPPEPQQPKAEARPDKAPEKEKQPKPRADKKPEGQETQKSVVQPDEEDHELLARIKKVFAKKDIEILEHKTIRKNSEIDMMIMIGSQAGKLKYYCKIKDKKKTSDKDLASLYVESQMKKLPVLYVTTGELSKKAEEMLGKEFAIISVMKV